MDTAPMKSTTLRLSKPIARPTTVKEPPRQWILWRRGGSRPKVRHPSLQAAVTELTRLRQLCPEARFEIFELVPVRDIGGARR